MLNNYYTPTVLIRGFEKRIICIPKNWIRCIKRFPVVVVKRSIKLISFWQIRISQKQTTISNQISSVFSHSIITIFHIIPASRNKSPFKCFPHRYKTMRALNLFTHTFHPWLHHMTVKNLILIQGFSHVKT
ncbi:hypothetical protein Hanom_Chr10g00912151 [Helianthus anomalus]